MGFGPYQMVCPVGANLTARCVWGTQARQARRYGMAGRLAIYLPDRMSVREITIGLFGVGRGFTPVSAPEFISFKDRFVILPRFPKSGAHGEGRDRGLSGVGILGVGQTFASPCQVEGRDG